MFALDIYQQNAGSSEYYTKDSNPLFKRFVQINMCKLSIHFCDENYFCLNYFRDYP